MKFSTIMSANCPKNLHLLRSFQNPVLESDGVHLTPYSGYSYILHLFDSTNELLQSLKSSPEAFVLTHHESIRALEDRVVVLEKDHRRLNQV